MNYIQKLLIALVFAAFLTSCSNDDWKAFYQICRFPPDNTALVCSVPFESIFSQPDLFVDKAISLDGVLVIGTKPDSPGVPIILLFPSVERVAFCNHRFAIEIHSDSGDNMRDLKLYQGWLVNVAGTFERGADNSYYWGSINLLGPPTPLGQGTNAYGDVYRCMQPPPPPPAKSGPN